MQAFCPKCNTEVKFRTVMKRLDFKDEKRGFKYGYTHLIPKCCNCGETLDIPQFTKSNEDEKNNAYADALRLHEIADWSIGKGGESK